MAGSTIPEAWRLLVTCEHGGRAVPPAYRPLFDGAESVPDSHRAWDPGALDLARRLARACGGGLLYSRVTRLLADLNRSPGHPRLFSGRTRVLDRADRERLLSLHYFPHRRRVHDTVSLWTNRGFRVLHVAVHSFTPVMDGRKRRLDAGLLYDPKRGLEKTFCGAWKRELGRAAPERVCRLNAPYRGDSDGLTTALRREFPARVYLGLELEVNQKHLSRATHAFGPPLRSALVESLARTLPSLTLL